MLRLALVAAWTVLCYASPASAQDVPPVQPNGAPQAAAPRLEVHRGFLRPDRFVYGDAPSKKVYSPSGMGLHRDFRGVLAAHPEALRQAESSTPFLAGSLLGAVAAGIGAAQYVGNVGWDRGSGGLGLFLGGIAVAFTSPYLARARIDEAVRTFNEQQTAARAAPGTTPGPASGETGPLLLDSTAAGALPARASAPQSQSPKARPRGLESWYTYWGLGWSSPGYSGETEEYLDFVRDADGVSSTALSLDILGFYFPVGGEKLLLGGIINGAAERFAVEDEWVQYNQLLYAASAMYFLDQYIGRGFFVRGDLGLSRVVVNSSDDFTGVSGSGLGVLLGAGYAIPISSGTRLLLNANYARRSAEGETFNAFSISLGGLF